MMKLILNDSFRVFIIALVFVLGIGGALITGGAFDNWTSRLMNKKRKALLLVLNAKRLLKNKTQTRS
jgi:hypothetical protein